MGRQPVTYPNSTNMAAKPYAPKLLVFTLGVKYILSQATKQKIENYSVTNYPLICRFSRPGKLHLFSSFTETDDKLAKPKRTARTGKMGKSILKQKSM